VTLALDVDIDMAKQIVKESASTTDQNDRKRLWLLIARRVIEKGQDVGKAMAILKECDLRLEDILPFFPNFFKIGDFKDEICKSLELYNTTIDTLKESMEEYANNATLIRKDINELRNRSGFVSSTQKCDLCSQLVLTRQFFLFPCTHVFHVDCMIKEVSIYLEKNPRARPDISQMKTKKEKSDKKSGRSADEDAREKKKRDRMLEHFAASQCLFCGDIMIDSVQEPFISLTEEQTDIMSWKIRGEYSGS